MKQLLPFVLILRPVNVVLAGVSIALAALLVTPSLHCAAVWCAIVSGVLLTSGANVINDICDLAIDRINKPLRMLPAGRMSLFHARIYAIILLACGVIFSIFANTFAACIAASSALLVIIYSLWLKRLPLIGNLVVSLVTALAFIFGAIAACTSAVQWRVGFFPALFTFFFHFGREIVKDLEDQIGDHAAHARTLPLAYGVRAAQIAATSAFLAVMLVVLIPAQRGLYAQPYLTIVLCGVYPVLLYAMWQVWRKPEIKTMRNVSHLLKFDMAVGLLAIWLGTR